MATARKTVKEYIHPEIRNLAFDLDDDELGTIGEQVIEWVEKDENDRAEWLERHGKWLDIYFQKDSPLAGPWEGSSDESLPLLAEACNQFHARSYSAMFADPELVRVIPSNKTSDESLERAERVQKHMSWQLLTKDRTYKRNKDRLLLSVPLHGSFFTKTYYDPVKRQNVVRNVRASDLVVPYGTGPRDLEDIDRKTEIVWMSPNDTAILKRERYFIDVAEPYRGGNRNPVDDAHDKAHGVQQTHVEDDSPVRILESHCLLDLDDDGVAEPYIVTVDSETKQVLRVTKRWLTNEAGYPVDDQGRLTNVKYPIEYYTHYCFLENPDGFYGLGLGHLLAQPNSAVNKLLRQIIDSATLATAGNMSGFISDQIAGIEGGEMELSLGKFRKVPASGQDLASMFLQMKFPGPNPALIEALQLISGRSDRLATITEAVSGQTESVMQPTAIMSLLEEAGKVFSAVNERIVDSWGRELEKIYRLNATFMDPVEMFTVVDAGGKVSGAETGREDYKPDLMLRPVVDPKMTSEKQKLTRAEMEWNFLAQNPLVQQSPTHFRNASERFLKAIGAKNIDEVLPSTDPLNGIVAGLRAAGLIDEQIQVVLETIRSVSMAGQPPDQGGLETLGAPLPGASLEGGVVNGGNGSPTGPMGSIGLPQ